MTETAEPPMPKLNVVGAWLRYEDLRKGLEKNVKELELSNFNLTFGAKTEAEFRERLRQARILLDKITELIDSQSESSRTVVS